MNTNLEDTIAHAFAKCAEADAPTVSALIASITVMPTGSTLEPMHGLRATTAFDPSCTRYFRYCRILTTCITLLASRPRTKMATLPS